VDIYVDIQSPPLTRYNRFRPLTCWYRFKSIRGVPKEWVLRLTFKKFKVGNLVNSTHCDGGYLQVNGDEFSFNLHNFAEASGIKVKFNYRPDEMLVK
jgi:hypothetical protein